MKIASKKTLAMTIDQIREERSILEMESLDTTANMNRSAFVTGAAMGLGEGIVRRLARDGWSVLLLDNNPLVNKTAEDIASELGLRTGRLVSCADVSNVEQMERQWKRLFRNLAGWTWSLRTPVLVVWK
jgi:NAD(P)-dependent dehydrogenase (short-subunit alcohol dehydrogenase family)